MRSHSPIGTRVRSSEGVAAVIPIPLAAADTVQSGHGWEHIAYLLPGTLPTVVDPGPASASSALIAALSEHGFAGSDIRQVLLTSPASELAANTALFPDAVVRRGPRGVTDWLLSSHRDRASAVGDEVARHTAASEAAVARWRRWKELHAPADSPPFSSRQLDDGAMVLAGDLTLVASHRPAFSDAGLVFASLDGSTLFAGEFGVLDEDLPVGDWQAFAESLAMVTQGGPPERLYPSRGRIEASGHVALRSMALSANNLVTNLPLALARPATLVELFERDLGYWPDSIAESSLRLTRLLAALEELARAGVVHRQPSASLLRTRYAMVPA